MRNLTFIDLFAGVGGLTEGFMKGRGSHHTFRPLLLVDQDKHAAQTFQRNRTGIRYLVADISALDARILIQSTGLSVSDTPDAIIGGPPCQGFSRLRGKSALEDPRNARLKDFLNLVINIRPPFVLIENVPNLLTFDNGRFKDEVFKTLEDGDYIPKAKVLHANEYGVPQLRERAFIAAFREDLGISEFDFPKGKFPPIKFAHQLVGEGADISPEILTQYISVEEAIGDLPSLKPGTYATAYTMPPFSDYQNARRKNAAYLHNHDARTHSEAFLRKLQKIEPGSSNRDLDGRKKFDRLRENKYFSQAYGRLHADGISYTITTHFLNPGSGRFTHYRDLRSITVREAARFQSFDDDFIFLGTMERQQEHVGNAVPPLLARALAEHFGNLLAQSLDNLDGHSKQRDTFADHALGEVKGQP